MYEEIKAAAWQGAPLRAVAAGLGLTEAEMLRRYPRAQSVHDAARKVAERALAIPGWSRTPEGLWERIRLPRPQIEPAPEDIPDAFEQPWWTLKQVLIWVSSGKRDLVRDVGPVHGFESTFTIRDLRVLGRNGACYRTFEEAEDEVIEALQAGRLTATGKENGEGDRKEIPSLRWPDLRLQYEPYYFAAPKDYSRTATYYNDLLFPCKGVLANWPDPRESPAMADEQKMSTTAEQNETPEKRHAKILARHQELKAARDPHPTKTLAKAEGFSENWIRQMIRKARKESLRPAVQARPRPVSKAR